MAEVGALLMDAQTFIDAAGSRDEPEKTTIVWFNFTGGLMQKIWPFDCYLRRVFIGASTTVIFSVNGRIAFDQNTICGEGGGIIAALFLATQAWEGKVRMNSGQNYYFYSAGSNCPAIMTVERII